MSGRRQGRLVLADHRPAAGSTATRVDALVDALAARTGARRRDRPGVSSGAIAAGLGAAGAAQRVPATWPPSRPRPAWGRARSIARYTERFARHGLVGRPGAAHRRRRHPAQPLPQRLPDLRAAARARGRAGRQRERHRGDERDPLRRQRPPRRAGGPPGARRPLVLLSDVDGLYDGDPPLRRHARSSATCAVRGRPGRRRRRRGPALGVGTGGMVTKVEAARHRDGRRHPRALTSRGRAAEALVRRARWAPGSTPPASGAPTRLLWLAHASDTKGGVVLDAGAVRRADAARARRCCRPGSPASSGDVLGRRPGRPGRPRRRRDRPRDRQLRQRRAARRCSAGRPRELAAELGAEYEREVVHRDDLDADLTLRE